MLGELDIRLSELEVKFSSPPEEEVDAACFNVDFFLRLDIVVSLLELLPDERDDEVPDPCRMELRL